MKGKKYIVNNKEVILYPIGALCEKLERQTQTVRKWEKRGVIPEPQFRSKTGKRLYTWEQIEAIAYVVDKYKIKQGTEIPEEFIDDVFEAFRRASEEK